MAAELMSYCLVLGNNTDKYIYIYIQLFRVRGEHKYYI